jgi:long-subunit acyl-CoA synthetase (AMP-forming)
VTAALAPTFLACFRQRVGEHPDRVFLRQAQGDRFVDISYRQAHDQAQRMAAALADRGVARGDRVAILSKNCWHWIVADLAILSLGAVSVPYYPTLSADSLAELIALSDLKAIFIGKLDDYAAQASGIPAELIKVAFPPYGSQPEQADCLRWNELIAQHEPLAHPHEPTAHEPFTIIFTSGTTGTPKGVVLTYDAPYQLAIAESTRPVYGIFQGNAARVLSYLPLSHVAERSVTEITGILAGSEIYFAESIESFAANLRAARPTLFFAVPRIWTKLREGIISKLPERWLLLVLKLPVLGAALARFLRKQLGLNDARLVLSSAAPLAGDLHAFFARLGIHIQEVYGMSEVGGAATLAARGAAHAGVGQPLPFAEIKVAPDTQEILMRTPWMMTEYFRDPERSAQVLRDGFVHSGDTGRFDEHGNLHVIGRVNDTFKTSKGKFVVPAPLELTIATWPSVDQVLVTGRGLPQPIALICLSELGRKHARAELEAELTRALAAFNKDAAAHERLARVVVVDEPFSLENGLLTPTLKVRRHGVEARYGANFEEWASRPGQIVWA